MSICFLMESPNKWSKRDFDGILRHVGQRPDEHEKNYFYLFEKSIDKNPTKYYRDKGKKHPTPYLTTCWDTIRYRVKDFDVVVAVGAEPLRALTGHISIEKYRGSVIKIERRTSIEGNTFKVIGTYDPGLIVQGGMFAGTPVPPVMILDLIKAFKHSDDPEIEPIPRYGMAPTELMEFGEDVMEETLAALNRIKKGDTIAVDIETSPKAGIIWCMSIATSPTRAFIVPLYDHNGDMVYGSKRTLLLDTLQRVLEDEEIKKVGQNFIIYDMPWVAREWGINIKGYEFDTMLAMNVCFPEFPKRLDFMASIFTDIPYWKDEATDYNKINDWGKFWKYACTDVHATYDIYLTLKDELDELGFWDTFNFEMRHSFKMTEIGQRGVPLGMHEYYEMQFEMDAQLIVWEKMVDDMTEVKLNLNSPKQMVEYVYGWLGLPKQKKKDKYGMWNLTVDEDALKTLDHLLPDNKLITILLKYRKMQSLYKSIWTKTLVEENSINLMRSSYGWTKNARLRCSKDPFGHGCNIQQVPSRPVEFKED